VRVGEVVDRAERVERRGLVLDFGLVCLDEDPSFEIQQAY
jgi:hypothetical protein